MPVTLQELADWVGGEVDGNAAVEITAARPVGEAGPGDITFAADDRHIQQFHHSTAAAAFVPSAARANGKPIIRVHDPLAAFVNVFQRLKPPVGDDATGIHPTAVVHPSAKLGTDVVIGPFVVIGAGTQVGDRCRLHAGAVVGANCKLGEDVVLHPHAVLYDGTILGAAVIIHAHSVIGADGFGYRNIAGEHCKVPQLGHVEIEDGVEVGACTTIDRGTFGATRIGQGTKIDNLVQIGHNCRIGRRNILVAQAGIAGSSQTGDQVIIAGQAGIRDHITIGDRAVVGPQAGVSKDVKEGEWVLGTPAVPEREFKITTASMFKLPEMRKTLRRIVRQLGLTEDGA